VRHISAGIVPRGTRRRGKTPEGYVLEAIMQYLAVKKIFCMRMNSGAIPDKRGIPVRMHEPGTADVLVFQPLDTRPGLLFAKGEVRPVWIEAKAQNGTQSELQKLFQKRVEEEGHVYILARGIEDLEAAGL
jgi:hypothetical protein